jgi:hypothetical protein
MIAAEKGELETFVPESLTNLAEPPAFRLRPATGREMRTYRRIMQVEGLIYHGKEEMREEMLRALRALYDPATFETSAGRLRSYWALLDQDGKPAAEDEADVSELVGRVTREWRPLRQLAVDNDEFGERSLEIAVSMFLAGWSGIDLAYRMEEGRTPLDLIEKLREKLVEIEEKAVADKVEGAFPGLAFMQLCLAAQRHLGLQQDEEKNSDSPPSIPRGRNGSTKRRSGKTGASKSKASASSGSTRKGGSAASPARTTTAATSSTAPATAASGA